MVRRQDRDFLFFFINQIIINSKPLSIDKCLESVVWQWIDDVKQTQKYLFLLSIPKNYVRFVNQQKSCQFSLMGIRHTVFSSIVSHINNHLTINLNDSLNIYCDINLKRLHLITFQILCNHIDDTTIPPPPQSLTNHLFYESINTHHDPSRRRFLVK